MIVKIAFPLQETLNWIETSGLFFYVTGFMEPHSFWNNDSGLCSLSLSLSPRNERSVTRCLQYSLRLISTFALLVDYSKSLLQKCLAFIGRIFKRLDWLMEENRTKCCYYDWLVQRSLVMNNGIEAQIFV